MLFLEDKNHGQIGCHYINEFQKRCYDYMLFYLSNAKINLYKMVYNNNKPYWLKYHKLVKVPKWVHSKLF